jgi:hypothetical protein
MEGMRIKEAVKSFNERRGKGVEKLTGTKLGQLVMPDLNISTVKGNIWRWEKGLQKISSEELCKVCEICKVDPNFIFGYKSKYSK